MTIGRNDPCPCGSKKKYKLCHGAIAEAPVVDAYDRIRRLDGEAGENLIHFIAHRYGQEGFRRAFKEYGATDEDAFNPSTPQGDSFIRWISFNWRPDGNRTVADIFIASKRGTISADALRLIEATLEAPFSFYQVLSVDSGSGASLRDILRKRDVAVRERAATASMRPGLIMYARVVALDGLNFFMGCGASVITPSYMNPLVTLRSHLESSEHLVGGALSRETLLGCEPLLREKYFEIEDTLMHPKRTVLNRDNDPYLLHTLRYTVSSADDAFHAMKTLQQQYTHESDAELLEKGVHDGNGTLAEISLDWIKDASDTHGVGDNIRVASISIVGTTMTIGVNSKERAQRVQDEVRTRLGTNAVLQTIETVTPEELAARPPSPKTDEERAARLEEDRRLRESPEVQAQIAAMMEAHWKRWPDTSIPALRNMTPRQAANDPIGRELLESLLLEIELRSSIQADPLLRVDCARLRRELGMQ